MREGRCTTEGGNSNQTEKKKRPRSYGKDRHREKEKSTGVSGCPGRGVGDVERLSSKKEKGGGKRIAPSWFVGREQSPDRRKKINATYTSGISKSENHSAGTFRDEEEGPVSRRPLRLTEALRKREKSPLPREGRAHFASPSGKVQTREDTSPIDQPSRSATGGVKARREGEPLLSRRAENLG